MVALIAHYTLFRWSADDEWYVSVTYLGALLNLLVLSVNGLRMPVKTDEISFDPWSMHKEMTEHTRLNALGDWMNIKVAIVSPGDILIWSGLVAPLLYEVAVSLKGVYVP